MFAVIFGAGVSVSPVSAREVPFAEPPAISTEADGARSVFAADVDGDGDLDALSASTYDDKIAWYENDGTPDDGGWTPHTISTAANGAYSVFAADVDGDLDALSASFYDDKIAWYENDGAGGGWTLHTISAAAAGAFSVFAADVDGDGDLDALSALFVDDKIAWYENDGTPEDGGWTLHTISTAANGARSVFAADVDGDGDLDALSASSVDDKIAWYENDGAGGGWTLTTISLAADTARSVFAADVDGDGDLDALSASSVDDKIAWYENETIHRSAAFPAETVISLLAADSARSVFAADVDGDGDLDALSASSVDDKIAWYENDGAGGGWTLHTISTAADGAFSVFAADVDGDGDLDALSASFVDDKIAWYENDGTPEDGGWTLHTISTAADGAFSVFAADVDVDGDLDALSASGFDHTIAWYENDGTPEDGGWTLHTISLAADVAYSVFAADVDGDGDVDALSASAYDDTIAWYENDGAGGGWTPNTISTAADGAVSVFAADVDGDGDLDALSASYYDDTIAWYENDGAGGTWTLHTISSAAAGARSVLAADVDGDGDLDALSASSADDKIAWYENDGAGGGWTLTTISTAADGAFSVFAADVDVDGDLDALSASSGSDDKIAWYQNRGGQFALPTTDVAQKVVGNSEVHDLLAMQVIHRGRAGDTDIELASLELLLTDGAVTPLSNAQANALIQELRIYVDDGSGAFEESSDTEVAVVFDLSLTNGVQTIDFVDGDVRVAHGAPKTLFVVAAMTADADSQPLSAFSVEHLTEASSAGEDAEHDIPLTLEFATNVGTERVDTELTSESCQAPFDLELANRTVVATVVCEAGTVLRAGNAVVVVSPGDLTLRAGQKVALTDGLEVDSGALSVDIDPNLQP